MREIRKFGSAGESGTRWACRFSKDTAPKGAAHWDCCYASSAEATLYPPLNLEELTRRPEGLYPFVQRSVQPPMVGRCCVRVPLTFADGFSVELRGPDSAGRAVFDADCDRVQGPHHAGRLPAPPA